MKPAHQATQLSKPRYVLIFYRRDKAGRNWNIPSDERLNRFFDWKSK